MEAKLRRYLTFILLAALALAIKANYIFALAATTPPGVYRIRGNVMKV